MRLSIIKLFIFIFLILFLSCNGEDVKGKIIIEYFGDWTAEISVNRKEKEYYDGNGNWDKVYMNPDELKAVVTKLDSSQNKLTLYIYQDERIVESASTRESGGSVSVEYLFSF